MGLVNIEPIGLTLGKAISISMTRAPIFLHSLRITFCTFSEMKFHCFNGKITKRDGFRGGYQRQDDTVNNTGSMSLLLCHSFDWTLQREVFKEMSRRRSEFRRSVVEPIPLVLALSRSGQKEIPLKYLSVTRSAD